MSSLVIIQLVLLALLAQVQVQDGFLMRGIRDWKLRTDRFGMGGLRQFQENRFGVFNLDRLIQFKLWTRNNPNNGKELKMNQKSYALQNFNISRPTKVIIHGFADSSDYGIWMADMRRAYLEKEDVNVLVVDYSFLAILLYAWTNFPQVTAKRVASMLHSLSDSGANLDSFHIVGKSWGSHVAGMAGKALNGRIGRITGLDLPTNPFLLQFLRDEHRLDKSDAQFVDIFHFNPTAMNSQPKGHVDIYRSSEENEVGCPDENERYFSRFNCGSDRAMKYFIKSIKDPKAFSGCPCETFEAYVGKNCDCGSEDRQYIGEHIDKTKAKGVYQFWINSSKINRNGIRGVFG